MPEVYEKAAKAMNADPLEDVSLDSMFKEAGFTPETVAEPAPIDVQQPPEQLIEQARTPEDKSMLEKIFQNTAPNFASGISGSPTTAGTATAPSGTEVPNIAKGAAQGAVGIADMAANLLMDVGYTTEKFIKDQFGVTDAEMQQPDKIDWKSKLQSPDDNLGTQLTAGIIQYMAPGIGVAKVFNLGMVGAATTNIAIDTFLMDPNQDRLANLVTEKLPGLRDWVAVGNALSYLEHTDGEGNWEGRFKNGLESFFFNAFLPGIPKAVSTAKEVTTKFSGTAKGLAESFGGYLKAQRGVKAMIDAGTNVGKNISRPNVLTAEARILKNAEQLAVDNLKKFSAANKALSESPEFIAFKNLDDEVAALEKNAPAIASVEVKQAHADLLAQKTKELDAAQDAMLSSTANKNLDEAQRISQESVDAHEALKKGPSKQTYRSPILDKNSEFYGKLKDLGGKSIDEIVSRTTDLKVTLDAEAILKDPEQLRALMSKDFTTEAFTAAEGQAYRTLAVETTNEFVDSLKSIDLNSDEALVEVLDRLRGLQGVEVSSEVAGRLQGQALRARKIESIQGISLEEFKARLVGNARLKFIQDQLRLEGGKENIQRLVEGLRNINTPDDVAKLEFLQRVAAEKTLPKMLRSTTFGMYNSMLGIKSFTSAVTGNLVSTTVGLADNINTVVLQGFKNSGTYRKMNGMPLLTAIQKQDPALRFAAQIKGYQRGIMNSIAGFGRPEMNQFKATKLGLNIPGLTAKQQMGITEDMNMVWQTWGTMMQTIGLNGTSTKILGTADEFFGGINYHMKLSELAHDSIISKAIPPEGYESAYNAFMENPEISAHRNAMDFAEGMVLSRNAPEGTISKIITESPGLKLVLPFTRVTYNSARFAIEHSPFEFATSRYKSIMKYGTQLEKDQAMAKIITGTTAIGSIALLSSMGEVNGPVSPNWRVVQATAESGKEYLPYSIHGVSVEKFDTIRPWIDLGHTLMQINKYASSEQYEQASINAGAAVASFFTSKQLMENISDVADLHSAITNGDITTGDQVEKFLVNFAGRFAPKMLLEAAQLTEQYTTGEVYKRRVKETGEGLKGVENFTAQLKNQFLSHVPYFNKDLPVQRNIFGEPQLMAAGLGPDVISPMAETRGSSSEIMTRLQILAHATEQYPGSVDDDSMKLSISVPGAVVSIPEKVEIPGGGELNIGGTSGLSYSMTPKELDRYQQYYGNIHEGAEGPTLREETERALGEDSALWEDLTGDTTENEYRKNINRAHKVFTNARRRANMLIMQDPEFRAKYDKRAEQFIMESRKMVRTEMMGQ